jgi:hypothetical protein
VYVPDNGSNENATFPNGQYVSLPPAAATIVAPEDGAAAAAGAGIAVDSRALDDEDDAATVATVVVAYVRNRPNATRLVVVDFVTDVVPSSTSLSSTLHSSRCDVFVEFDGDDGTVRPMTQSSRRNRPLLVRVVIGVGDDATNDAVVLLAVIVLPAKEAVVLVVVVVAAVATASSRRRRTRDGRGGGGERRRGARRGRRRHNMVLYFFYFCFFFQDPCLLGQNFAGSRRVLATAKILPPPSTP